MELKHCQGCGVELQTEEPNRLGYIPPSAIEKETYLCQRCFRIKNYNEVVPVKLDENDFMQILNSIAKTNSVVMLVVDLFDIDGTFITGLQRFIGKNPFIIVANKLDLFPKAIRTLKVKNWLKNYARQHALFPEAVFLISADKQTGLEELVAYMSTHIHKDIYVVGATNVGKSTLINQIISSLSMKNDIELTTSKFPGTTLNSIEIPLPNGKSIIDTPGIVHKHRFNEMVFPDTLKKIMPKKTVKPKVFQLIGNQSLFIGGLARIDQVGESKNSFVFYISNELMIHRTKITNADNLYQKHLGEVLSPPSLEEAKTYPSLIKHSFRIKEKKDIVISGLGWITIDGNPVSVEVYVPKGVGVHIRDALI